MPVRQKRLTATSKRGRRLHADGFDPKTNTAYQFHGDYWHGNPNRYEPNVMNKISKKSMNELYQNTLDNEQRIKNAGYNLVTIWEMDWRAYRKTLLSYYVVFWAICINRFTNFPKRNI